MKREQALSQVAPNLSYFNDCKVPFAISECKSWINKIFDDFEAQIKAKDEHIKELEEAMSHKKCGGCKHYEEKQCTNENSIAFGGINAVYKDDFCNDFEPKDNV